ncbi:MAG: S8 family serine peptidase, partial [Actinobacteria bacterium]|nr:S8 family serine peptidase [Actinomycetota bacterium]
VSFTACERNVMKLSTIRILLIVAAVAAVAFGQNPFRNQTNTTTGYSTWDSDMINIENVTQTGAGVYVAVLDTGLVPNWRDYFPEERIATKLGTGFEQPVIFKTKNLDPCGFEATTGRLRQSTWVGSTGSTHGTHVVSTIIGYFYRSNSDALGGFPLPPIMVRGIAPGVTIIPVKVLANYQVPALPRCTNPGPAPSQTVVFGTDEMIAAGINYATDLAIAGYKPMVISMSLGGSGLADVEKDAIDRAIANGVIVVAAAGNEGIQGMGYPGAYPPVISAGSAGWVGEWLKPGAGPRYRMWWLKYPYAPMLPGSGEVADPTDDNDVYVSDFSSRALPGQELDVLAPGSWVRGPFPGDPGFSHLPWWSKGIADLRGHNPGNFYYVGGTSMATPHVTSVAALMLQKNPNLDQSLIESILKSSALLIPSTGSRVIWNNTAAATITWDTDCGSGTACDPVGAGLIQADQAIAATP